MFTRLCPPSTVSSILLEESLKTWSKLMQMQFSIRIPSTCMQRGKSKTTNSLRWLNKKKQPSPCSHLLEHIFFVKSLGLLRYKIASPMSSLGLFFRPPFYQQGKAAITEAFAARKNTFPELHGDTEMLDYYINRWLCTVCIYIYIYNIEIYGYILYRCIDVQIYG